MKYIKLYLKFFSLSLSAGMQYRVNITVWFLIAVLGSVMRLVFLRIVTSYSGTIAGWSYGETLVLTGILMSLQGFSSITFMPMIYGFSRFVREGELERFIYHPVDTLFLATFRYIDIEDIANIPLGLGFIALAILSHDVAISVGMVLPVVFAMILGLLIIHAFITFIVSLAFVFTHIGATSELIWNFLDLGSVPIGIYKGIWHFILLYILPIGLIATLPSDMLLGRPNWPLLGYSAIFTLISLLLSRWIFYRLMRRYEGVSN